MICIVQMFIGFTMFLFLACIIRLVYCVVIWNITEWTDGNKINTADWKYKRIGTSGGWYGMGETYTTIWEYIFDSKLFKLGIPYFVILIVILICLFVGSTIIS